MFDTTKYLTIPIKQGGRSWEGVDCWGLAVVLYKEELGIELPSMDHVDWNSGAKVCNAMAEESSRDWIEVERNERRKFDVVSLRIRTTPWHVGILIDDKRFIHADANPGRGVVVERLDGMHWKSRIVGYFRHPDMVEKSV